jgi:hypothetical protein
VNISNGFGTATQDIENFAAGIAVQGGEAGIEGHGYRVQELVSTC